MGMRRLRFVLAGLALAVIAGSALAKFADLRNLVLAGVLLVGVDPAWSGTRWCRPATGESCARARPSGFTLIEVVLSIALLGLLISLALPSIARAKTKALSAVALTELRSHATVAAAYASDFKDSFICILDPAFTHTILVVPGTSRRERLAYFEQRFCWWYGLVGYYGGDPGNQSFFAPRKDGPGRLAPYNYTVSGLARPEYWRRETRTPTGQIGPMHLGDVLFPTRKGLFANFDANGARRRALRDYKDLEASLCDGSALVTQGASLNAPVPNGEGPLGWPYVFDPFGDALIHTLDGVRGADLR